jgi:hypothetical protein
MSAQGVYPFGTSLFPRPPSAETERSVFLMGAYPSALHVRWVPPSGSGLRPVSALPVADEPEPFWNGFDAAERVESWVTSMGPPDLTTLGTFCAPGKLNGSSGRWVDEKVLKALGTERGQAWITDCLDTYRLSTGVQARLEDTYDVGRPTFGWPEWSLARHPSEAAIIREAADQHVHRLRTELGMCKPELIVTLGNAALRTMRVLLETGPKRIAVADYGAPIRVPVGNRTIDWFPLAHPAAPPEYQLAHTRWAESTVSST